jgi:prophage DNA circulation protein
MGPASFRGVAFHVDTAERTGGRRGVTHEYPFRDTSFREDTGGKAKAFTVEGYVIGPDYFTARDALLAELEREGPGELVHPYYGTLRVALDGDYRVRETRDRGGMAVFSIPFIETPVAPVQPTAVIDATATATASATAAQAAVEADFLSTYVTDATLTTSVAGALRSATLHVNGLLATVDLEEQELATMKRRVSEFEDSIASVIGTPADIIAGLSGLLGGLGSVAALRSAYDFDPGVRPPDTTPNRADEQTNFDAVQRLVQRMAVVQAATLTLTESFDSYDEAVAAREAITDPLDEQADIASDDTYPALLQLRADLVKAVPGEGGDLPRLLTVTLSETTPSLVLSHRLYGNLDGEADILARNGVRHPGFVVGGRALEVLSDD